MSRRTYAAAIMLGVTVVVLLCHALSADGMLGSIEAVTDAQVLTVGDPFWYSVTLRLPADSRPSLPGLDAEFSGFEVRDYEEETTSLANGQQQVALRYQLVSFTVGEKQIADFQIEAERELDGETDTEKYVAPPVKVSVESVLPPEGGEPKPIYGPVFLAPWWYSWLKPTGIALAALVALLVVVWLLHRRARCKAAAPETELTPHEVACLALHTLGEMRLIAAGNLNTFYSELGDIMRRWLEYRTGVPAMELTTGLIRYDLRRSDLEEDWQYEFVALLRRADLVKFARWLPDDEVAYGDLDLAGQLLQRGAVVEPEPDADEGVETGKGAAA